MIKILKRIGILVSMLVALITPLGFMAAPAYAEQTAYNFSIQPQSLKTALKAFSEVSNFQFVYSEAEIAEIMSNGVEGHLAVDDSLLRLLDGTNVKLEYVNDNTVRLYLPQAPLPKKENSNKSANLSKRSNPLALEEIIVTAQKRKESLQDVPVAVAAVAGESLRANGISSLQDLTISTPSLYVAESFVGDSIFVRGIGSGQNNLGFEQAVGQVVDGIFYGRSRFSRISFLDIERVEVLKGPQGALIGKNTTAGAINITTAKPTSEFEGWVLSTYEFEADEGISVEGAVSGPLTETLKGRMAFKYVDRDGYIKNTTTGDDDVGVEDLLGRVSLAWDAADDLELLFQYQHGEIDRDGGNNQYSSCARVPADPQEDCKANYRRSGTATKNGINVEGKETDFETYSLTVNWNIGDYTLTSLTGYAAYDYTDLQDGDRTSAELTLPEFAEDYDQWSQEFRITSPLSDRYDYIVGLYFMEKEQDTDYIVHFAVPPVPGWPTSRNTFTSEEGSTYAVFGQITTHLNDQWDLTLGGRFTYEEKEARSIQVPTELYTTTAKAVCGNPIPGVCNRHDISDDFDEENFSPSINIQWRPNDDAMYYASFRRGFKAGGYDHNLVADSGVSDLLERFVFDSEEVTAYELGAKLTLADGAAQLNAAIFRSEFDDLQLGGFLDSASAINTVTNAGSAISQGVEIDIRWRASERLSIFGSLAYLDSTYDEYKNAPCYTLQTTGCVNGRQDLSDEKLQFASDWSGSLSAEYYWSLPQGLELTGFVQFAYLDDHPLQADLDPKLFQDSYVKIDARLTLSNADNSWELSLIGRNLDNELTTSYGDDVPAQAGTVWRSVDSPRSIALQGQLRF